MSWTPTNKSSAPSWTAGSKSSAPTWSPNSKSTTANSFLLLENGFYLLLENGFKLILEQSNPGMPTWTPQNKS